MRISIIVLALSVFGIGSAQAATKQVMESPAASIQQTVGITEIALSYHRPAVKGREIWGKLVPYDKVWRAGANQATTLSFSTPVKVAGKPVAAGVYGLFVVPSKDKWTFVLSKDAKQWGAYAYKPENDALRFEVTPTANAATEWLSFALDLRDKNSVDVTLAWEKLKAGFSIEVDVDGTYEAYLASELKAADGSKNAGMKCDAYLTAAIYWVRRGDKLDDAAKLLDKTNGCKESLMWTHEFRARLLAKQGKLPAAVESLDKAKALATGKMPQDYLSSLEALRSEWTKQP